MTAKPIRAVFTSHRPLPSRNVGVLTFEVALEAYDAAVAALGGTPLPSLSAHVGIVRLRDDAAAADAAPHVAPAAEPTLTPAERYARKTEGQKAVVRAGLLCEDPLFQSWICGTNDPPTEANAAAHLRRLCGVTSRKEFTDNRQALGIFCRIEDQFKTAQRVAEYPANLTGRTT